jgi:Flp pilus assembly protein TadD
VIPVNAALGEKMLRQNGFSAWIGTMKKPLLLSCILFITFMAFLPSLSNDFTGWDDNTYVTENAAIKSLTWDGVKNIFSTTVQCLYSPLVVVSFALEYHFSGLHPFIYHFDNLLLHLCVCALVFWFISIFSKKVEIAALATIFFGIHPFHVESVAWVAERKDMLYSLFFLGSLLSYFYYAANNKRIYYYLSLLLIVFSFISKPQALLFVFVLVLFDYFHFHRVNKKILIEKVPFFIIALAFGIINALGASASKGGPLSKETIVTIIPHLLNASYGIIFYLYKLTVPVHLSCLYPHPEQTGGIAHAVYLISPGIVALLGILVLFSMRYTKKVVIAGLFFIINLLIVLQTIPTNPSIVADRYSYIPSIGFFYILSEGIVWLYNRKMNYGVSLLMIVPVIIGLLSFQTWNRCKVWKNNETLWTDAIKKYPQVIIAHYNLGNYLLKQNRFDEAISNYKEELRIRPNYSEAHTNLGVALTELGRFDEANEHFTKSLQINPNDFKARATLGAILVMQGRTDEAIEYLTEALRSNPQNADAHINLGVALREQGRLDEAIEHLTIALHIAPDDAMAHYNLGRVFAKYGRVEDAISHYTEALRIQPDFASAREYLDTALIIKSQNHHSGGF